MRLIKKQKGFTLTPALFIIILLIMAGVTYMTYVINSGKTSKKIESSQAAKFAAETGISQIKSQFSKLNKFDTTTKKIINEWYRAKDYNNNCLFYSISGCADPVRSSSNTARESEYIAIKDDENRVIAEYKITIEDGSFVEPLKTQTGSAIEGEDRYGNKIWSSSSDKNFHNSSGGVFRYGVRVDGFAMDPSGKREKSSQSIYAVIDVPKDSSMSLFTNWEPGIPSDYLLTTDGIELAGVNFASDRYLTFIGGQILTGKVHSNKRINFQWNGNFVVGNSSIPSINDKYTVNHARWSGAADPSPILVNEIVREVGQPTNQLTIYGTNFSLDKTKTNIVINGSSSFNPTSVEEGKEIVPPSVTPTPVGFATKLVITLPGSLSFPYVIDITSLDRAQTIRYTIEKDENIKKDVTAPSYVPPLKIHGIMQVAGQRGFATQRIYTQDDDYRLIGPPTYPNFNAPYIAWDPLGLEPTYASYYETTYITDQNIPHSKIKLFGSVTYGENVLPELSYIHSHKAPGTNMYPWSVTHDHKEIFSKSGIKLLTANYSSDYFNGGLSDWGTNHKHFISPSLLTYTPSIIGSDKDDLFFYYPNESYRPVMGSTKISPMVYPNNTNYYTQRMYAAQIMKLMLNKNLSKSVDNKFGSLNEISEDRENGYYDLGVGGMVDFRSTYFGNELKYADGSYVLPLGSKITDTKNIFVNDNPDSDEYMLVDTYQKDLNYHSYIYRQIPKNVLMTTNDEKYSQNSGIIFVRGGVVRIGGANKKGSPVSTDYTNILGNNTIIDGRLTIISYSEEKPTTYTDTSTSGSTDNNGDIVITGNVIYKNRISPKEKSVVQKDYMFSGVRQYLSHVKDSPSTSQYITKSDGTPVIPMIKDSNTTVDTAKVDGLALIASNDIKIPVSHYYHNSTMENHYTTPTEELNTPCPCKDSITIHGQLIAGHQITQTKISNSVVSQNDRLTIVGSMYSNLPPNLSYFNRYDPTNNYEDGLGRIYLYDKSLYEFQLAGVPIFSASSNYSTDSYPVIGSNLARIVPGTWKVVSDGAQ